MHSKKNVSYLVFFVQSFLFAEFEMTKLGNNEISENQKYSALDSGVTLPQLGKTGLILASVNTSIFFYKIVFISVDLVYLATLRFSPKTASKMPGLGHDIKLHPLKQNTVDVIYDFDKIDFNSSRAQKYEPIQYDLEKGSNKSTIEYLLVYDILTLAMAVTHLVNEFKIHNQKYNFLGSFFVINNPGILSNVAIYLVDTVCRREKTHSKWWNNNTYATFYNLIKKDFARHCPRSDYNTSYVGNISLNYIDNPFKLSFLLYMYKFILMGARWSTIFYRDKLNDLCNGNFNAVPVRDTIMFFLRKKNTITQKSLTNRQQLLYCFPTLSHVFWLPFLCISTRWGNNIEKLHDVCLIGTGLEAKYISRSVLYIEKEKAEEIREAEEKAKTDAVNQNLLSLPAENPLILERDEEEKDEGLCHKLDAGFAFGRKVFKKRRSFNKISKNVICNLEGAQRAATLAEKPGLQASQISSGTTMVKIKADEDNKDENQRPFQIDGARSHANLKVSTSMVRVDESNVELSSQDLINYPDPSSGMNNSSKNGFVVPNLQNNLSEADIDLQKKLQSLVIQEQVQEPQLQEALQQEQEVVAVAEVAKVLADQTNSQSTL